VAEGGGDLMLEYFRNLAPPSLTLGDFIFNVFVACLCGLVHIAFYRAAYRGPGYCVSFLNALVLLSMITAVVIMVIGDSLARAFGLVGAMSIIRFRTAVKEVLDIVHIFLALAIGMTAGVGLHSAALVGTVLLGVIYYLLVHFNVISSKREQYVVQFTYRPLDGMTNGQEPPYLGELRKHCRHSKLVNARSVGDDDEMEISFYVKPKRDTGVAELLRELKSVGGIRSVMVFSDEEQF
jgi:uncharacterized membrane protein YhiD involved in acid resistance